MQKAWNSLEANDYMIMMSLYREYGVIFSGYKILFENAYFSRAN